MTALGWTAAPHCLTGEAPHRRGGHTHREIVHAWTFAAALLGACGVVLFGLSALKILIISILAAAAAQTALGIANPSPAARRIDRACLTGLVFGLTMPAGAPWYVAMLGSLIAIMVGGGVFGGYLHSALVGRVIVQFVFAPRLSLTGALAFSPVLASGHLLVGDIERAERVFDYQGWQFTADRTGAEALLLKRPVQILRQFAESGVEVDGDLIYEPLLRDVLPPWRDTVLGVVPGGIGETCALMIVITGLYLIHRGFLHWQLPAAILAAAALAASILPVEIQGNFRWFPVLAVENGRAVGLAYVAYHLAAGELLLGAFLIAGNTVASPMRVHGKMVFAAGIGVLTIFMRLYGVLEGECYWSILIMNALVGLIDRRMKRPVLGLGMAA